MKEGVKSRTLGVFSILQHFLVLFQISAKIRPAIPFALTDQRPLLLQLFNPESEKGQGHVGMYETCVKLGSAILMAEFLL